MMGSQRTRWVTFETGRPKKSVNATPVRVMTAISSSPRNTTSRVWLRIAGMSEATKNSPSPRPTTMGGPHSVLEAVGLHLTLDQMRDDLRVGFRDELVALPLELLLQIQVVLDDAVVDDDDLARAVAVRVGVFLGWPAVRRPARVADAVLTRQRIGDDHPFEVRQLAGASPQVHRAAVHDRDARRIVAAVLELSQPLDENGHDILRPDISDNPA